MCICDISTGLQHVGIPTNDIAKTIALYEALEFRIVHRKDNLGEDMAFLKMGNLVLETYQNHKAVGVSGAIDHIALNVTDVEEARRIADGLKLDVIEEGQLPSGRTESDISQSSALTGKRRNSTSTCDLVFRRQRRQKRRSTERKMIGMTKVLLLNGSPHANGCTAAALKEMIRVFEAEGVETELIHVGNKDIRGCIACGSCMKTGRCAFNDPVNEAAARFEAADGLVIGSPVYYASPNGTLLSFIDRLFYSTRFSKHMKVGAAVVSARRGGNTASFDVLNKYFSISGMPIATATYWNQVHGFTAEDVEKDAEGLQTMRNLARNMVFLMKVIADGKEKYGLPEVEHQAFTSFPDGK